MVCFRGHSCQATLNGDIHYGLQAYQLRSKATKIVKSYVILIQADLWMITTNHNTNRHALDTEGDKSVDFSVRP